MNANRCKSDYVCPLVTPSPLTPLQTVGVRVSTVRRYMTTRSALLLAGLLLLTQIGCGDQGAIDRGEIDRGTIRDAPANQRYWHEGGNFVVLHWDAVPGSDSYEVYYFRPKCGQDNYCRASFLGVTTSTSVAVFLDEGLYSYQCDQGDWVTEVRNGEEGTFLACWRGPVHSDSPVEDVSGLVHDFRVAACAGETCIDHSAADASEYVFLETIAPAQRLDRADGSVPDIPGGFQAAKLYRENDVDDAQVIWEPVHGAMYYEIWVGTGPSTEFTLGQRVESYGLMPWGDAADTPAEAMLHVERYQTPVNRGGFGEYRTTSWKLRACTGGGCSPFTEALTID